MAEITGMTSAGPTRERPHREVLITQKKAALWKAVWEASQFLSADDIRHQVEGTLAEIESDEP